MSRLQSFFDAKKMDVEKRETATAIVMQEQKSSILSQIHRIIGPFMLRRKKSEVDVTILPLKGGHVHLELLPGVHKGTPDPKYL